MTVAVIDFGMGNLGAIPNMLRRAGVKAVVTGDPSEIENASRLILPGVGAFDAAMRNLRQRGLIDVLRGRALDDGVPFLGVCLGMELLADRSDEGTESGLGWVPGDVVKFRFERPMDRLPVPHMGWNDVRVIAESPLFEPASAEPRFYFAHSYHFVPKDLTNAIGLTRYGVDFVSVVARGNVYGVQFHPEKSHRFGLELLRRFASS